MAAVSAADDGPYVKVATGGSQSPHPHLPPCLLRRQYVHLSPPGTVGVRECGPRRNTGAKDELR